MLDLMGSGRWWCSSCGRRRRRAVLRRAERFCRAEVCEAALRGATSGVKMSMKAGELDHRSAAVRTLRACAVRSAGVPWGDVRHRLV
jgi:hypothetical protein